MKIKAFSMKLVVFILVIISIVLCLSSLSKPEPATWGYLIADIAFILASAFAYNETKDNLWLIMLIGSPWMLISDLYFFPRFSANGLIWTGEQGGMNIWQGLHFAIFGIGCFFYFKDSKFRYTIPVLLLLSALTNLNLTGGGLARTSAGMILALVAMFVVYGFLLRYGLTEKNYIFSLGVLMFLIDNILAVLYYFYITHDISPFTLAWIDKLNTIARSLMAAGMAVAIERSAVK